MQISISILAGELINLKSTLQQLDSQLVDLIHLDVMDGSFVPQLSFGESYATEVAKASNNIPLDIHLMVAQPEREVPKYLQLKPRFLTFHIEATTAPVRLAQSIREAGIGCGIALSPATPVTMLAPVLLAEIDLIVLMSVEPGYYGQKFLEGSLAKVRQLKEYLAERNIKIEVDGGIGRQNIVQLKEAGADIVVSGAACFQTPDVNANVRELKALCS